MQVAGTTSLALCVAFVAMLYCAGEQTVHGYLRVIHSSSRTRTATAVYEIALLVHMLIMAGFFLSCAGNWADAMVHFVYFGIPLNAALYANALLAVVPVFISVLGIEDDELPADAGSSAWLPVLDALAMILCIPAVLNLLGDLRFLILYGDVAYFLFRTAYVLILDKRMRSRMVSPLSIAEAMRRFPEGILYADRHGHTLIANDAMRHCLSALGLSADFGTVDALWRKLNEKAKSEQEDSVVRSVERDPGDWVILRIGPDEVRLFSFEGLGFALERRYPSARPLDNDTVLYGESRKLLGAEASIRVIAYDVTSEVDILQELDRTNDELAASQEELRASMLTVQEAAENEAMLRMRGRVHDVIGQRLSMLHRALEDDDVSDEKLERLKPLLNGILDDLAAGSHIEPADELEATIDAFALTGVAVLVEGDLPADPQIAKLFANCIREGATNAVKHSRATEVRVTCSEKSLTVENDGNPPDAPLVEGTGLTSMRQAVEAAGGTLSVKTSTPFTLRIELG